MAGYLILVTMLALANAKTIIFENRRGDTIWPGSLGNAGKDPILEGGWEMTAGSTLSVEVDDSWAGRFWARTGCNFDASGAGTCETGDCGAGIRCGGAGGNPPVTLAEVTFNGANNQDYYDISNVDGFNVPVSMQPENLQGGGDKYRCNPASCTSNINDGCPEELQLKVGDRVVGCKSACLAFNTDQYCCRGECCGTPETCDPNTWTVNYPKYFKDKCPDAYSYAYDDQQSTFTCNDAVYRIIFYN